VNLIKRINLSAVFIVLVCFFLPWVHVSWVGATATSSGLNLARHDDSLLWLIPLLMGAVLVLGLLHARRENLKVYSITSAICGVIVVFLMNRQRSQVQNQSGLLTTQLTGWFWLAFIAAIGIVLTALALLLRRQRAPGD
jgi:nitrate/nitrite transporter NarK